MMDVVVMLRLNYSAHEGWLTLYMLYQHMQMSIDFQLVNSISFSFGYGPKLSGHLLNSQDLNPLG